MDTTDRKRVAHRLLRLENNDWERGRKDIRIGDILEALGVRSYLDNENDLMVPYKDVGYLASLIAAGGFDRAWEYDFRLNTNLLEDNVHIEQRLAKASDAISDLDGERVVRTDSILAALGLTTDSSGTYIRYSDVEDLIDAIRRPVYELKKYENEQTGAKVYICDGCGCEMSDSYHHWCPDCGARLMSHEQFIELMRPQNKKNQFL